MPGKITRSFNDVYRQIFSVNADLLANRLDAQKAMAFAANMKVMNDFINTEIKLHQIEMASGKALPLLGGRVISSDGEDCEPEAIECEAISADEMKFLGDSQIESNPAPRLRKPRLGFVGLTPPQAGEISAAFGEHADLMFWMDDGTPKLKPLAGCDVVFATSRIAHKTTGFLEANGLDVKRNFVKVTGSVSAMKHAVKSRFDRSKES